MSLLYSKSEIRQLLGVGRTTFSNKLRLFYYNLGGEAFKNKRILSPDEAINVLELFGVKFSIEELSEKIKEVRQNTRL
jgi:hypothetical protein